MHTARNTEAKRRWWVGVACLLMVPVALKMGFDFGNQLAGVLLGLAAAVNTAVLTALLVDFVVDRLLPLKAGAGGGEPPAQQAQSS